MNAKKSKKLLILGGVLAVACLITLLLLNMEQKREDIRESGETILEIPVTSVSELMWSSEGHSSFGFHKEGEEWKYDADLSFPVDADTINNMLVQFERLSATFTIEKPATLSDYGLDHPSAVISITADNETYEIELGDFSTMDQQRYVSIGDENVYLVAQDPYPQFDVELTALIRHDELPYLDNVSTLKIAGAESYSITNQKQSNASYREDDRYFAEYQGESVPLDTNLVTSYLQNLSTTTLHEYMTYAATEEELKRFGLDQPELSVSATYEDEESGVEKTVTLHVSRDPQIPVDAADEEITAYARVDESPILYKISFSDYENLMACSYNDLRHHQVLPVDFEKIEQIDVELDGQQYTFQNKENSDTTMFTYLDSEVDGIDVKNAMTALQALAFTDAPSEGITEIAMTLHLKDNEDSKIHISLDRFDGTHCLAVVDETSFALVDRVIVVNLIEAVHAIVLGDTAEEG